MSDFRNKIKKHLSWEFFWKFITMTLIGIYLVIYGISNSTNYSTLVQAGIIVLGVILTITGASFIRRNYQDM